MGWQQEGSEMARQVNKVTTSGSP